MILYAIAAVAFAVAAGAALLPSLVKDNAPGISGRDRAWWVNRLFALAVQADEAGDSAVAAAGRSLISALVAEKELPKKGR
jgi:hypothetical protein